MLEGLREHEFCLIWILNQIKAIREIVKSVELLDLEPGDIGGVAVDRHFLGLEEGLH